MPKHFFDPWNIRVQTDLFPTPFKSGTARPNKTTRYNYPRPIQTQIITSGLCVFEQKWTEKTFGPGGLHYLDVTAVGIGMVHLNRCYVTSNRLVLLGDTLTSQNHSSVPHTDTWGCERSEKHFRFLDGEGTWHKSQSDAANKESKELNVHLQDIYILIFQQWFTDDTHPQGWPEKTGGPQQ